MLAEGQVQLLSAERAHSHLSWFFLVLAAATSAALVLSGCAGMSTSNPPPATPQLVIVPNSVDFKNVVVGVKNTQTLQISNTGNAPLEIAQVQVTGRGFSIVSNSLPITLKPAQSQNITLVFDPVAPGSASGSLLLRSNDPHSPVTVAIKGTGEKAIAQVQATPSSISFGNLTVQTTSSKNVTLSNTGNVNVTINGVTVTGSGFGFSDLTPGFSLAPQQQVIFQVWFKPSAKGAVSGKLTVLSSNLTSPLTMALSGDGTASTSPPVQHTVTLKWDPSTSVVTGYHVYRAGVSGGPYSRLNSSLVGALSYPDSTVSSGATYYYVVTAVDNAGEESTYSNEIGATIPTP
jgi:hypothetical protein